MKKCNIYAKSIMQKKNLCKRAYLQFRYTNASTMRVLVCFRCKTLYFVTHKKVRFPLDKHFLVMLYYDQKVKIVFENGFTKYPTEGGGGNAESGRKVQVAAGNSQ